MNQRIQRLSDKALSKTNGFSSNDAHIRPLIMKAKNEEKLRIIREEYSKIIEIDNDSLLVGQYPSMQFYDRIEIDYEEIWRAAGASHENLESYANKVFIDGGNHFSADFEMLLTYGLSGLLDQIEEKKKLAFDCQKEFFDDLCYVAHAVTAWTQAYSDAARDLVYDPSSPVNERNRAYADVLNGEGDTDAGRQYSISYDRNNKPFAVIDTDILAGVPESDWVKTVKTELKNKFPNGVTIGNKNILITGKSRNELTNSKTSKKLRHVDKTVYRDKLSSLEYADDIMEVAQPYTSETPNHPRADDLVGFERGYANIQIGNNEYSAEVVVGESKNGTYRLHDIVNLTPIKIQHKFSDKIIKSPEHSQGMTEESILKKQSMDSSVDPLTGEEGERYSTDVSGDISDGRYRSTEYNGSNVSDISISHPDGSVNTPYYSDSRVTSPEERAAEVRESAEANDISPEDVAAFERVAEEFGVSIVFGEWDPDVGGDGYYENGTIYLNRNAYDPISVVFAHELAHHGEKSGWWNSYKSLALREMQRITGKDLATLRAEVTELYARHGKKLSTVGADSEIVAQFTQKHVLGNSEDLGRICEENPSLMQKVLDFFITFLEKIGIINEDTRRIDRARRMLAGALRDSGKRSGKVSGVSYKYGDANTRITVEDVNTLRSIGRKSVNDFTSEDIKKSEAWARKYYADIGTKSPFFRAWQGDWRAHDITPVEIAEIPEYIDSNEARKKNRGEVTNKDTKTDGKSGWVINISREGETNTISHSGDQRLSEYGLSGIKSLIENGILLDSEIHEHHTNNKPNEKITFDHKFYSLGKSTDGSIALYKITVEEFYQSKSEPFNKKFHNLRYIEKIAENIGGRTFGNNRSGGSTNDTSTINYSVADLFSLVKQYDSEFHPKEVDPHVLNDDGTPRVFYHGTNEEFTIFSPDELSPVEGSYFFAENLEDAQGYGDNIYEVYLSGKNLADYDNQPLEFYRLRNKRDQVEYLRARGYDGWYADWDSGGWGEISVFSNTQIKSATDNIGTFDGSNPDIQFSFSRSAGSLDADSAAEAERMESEGYTEDEIYDTVGLWKDSETGRWMRDNDTADVTGDGKINLADVSLLLKHIAKWDVVLGK